MNIKETIINPTGSRWASQQARIDEYNRMAVYHSVQAKRWEQKAKKAAKKSRDVVALLDAIAAPVARLLGCSALVSGPFGLFDRYSILFAGKESYNRDAWYRLTVQVDFDIKNGISIRYETKDVEIRFPAGSIGALNGGNLKTLPLPDTAEAIADLLTRKP